MRARIIPYRSSNPSSNFRSGVYICSGCNSIWRHHLHRSLAITTLMPRTTRAGRSPGRGWPWWTKGWSPQVLSLIPAYVRYNNLELLNTRWALSIRTIANEVSAKSYMWTTNSSNVTPSLIPPVAGANAWCGILLPTVLCTAWCSAAYHCN